MYLCVLHNSCNQKRIFYTCIQSIKSQHNHVSVFILLHVSARASHPQAKKHYIKHKRFIYMFLVKNLDLNLQTSIQILFFQTSSSRHPLSVKYNLNRQTMFTQIPFSKESNNVFTCQPISSNISMIFLYIEIPLAPPTRVWTQHMTIWRAFFSHTHTHTHTHTHHMSSHSRVLSLM
jgi:hypothetical protein